MFSTNVLPKERSNGIGISSFQSSGSSNEKRKKVTAPGGLEPAPQGVAEFRMRIYKLLPEVVWLILVSEASVLVVLSWCNWVAY